jgi:hypothetical protein
MSASIHRLLHSYSHIAVRFGSLSDRHSCRSVFVAMYQVPKTQPTTTMQQQDRANITVDASTSTSSVATQDGLVIYNVDAISFSASASAAAHFGAAAAHSGQNTRVLFNLLPHNAPSSFQAG